MELYERFEALMAKTLFYADDSGETIPLSEVRDHLLALAEEERKRSLSGEILSLEPEESASLLEEARFAVCAWVDERLLNSKRSDAANWLSSTLQNRYFGTSEAGHLFYVRLNDLLTRLDVPGEDVFSNPLDLVRRLELALPMKKKTLFSVLKVYALCLLYGFTGELYAETEMLGRVRTICRALLQKSEATERGETNPYALLSEKVGTKVSALAYLTVPFFVCLIFWFYCANLLTPLDIPLP